MKTTTATRKLTTTSNNIKTMQYLCTMIKQVKHEVAGVRDVRGDNSYMLVIHVEMQPPVRVQGQSKT